MIVECPKCSKKYKINEEKYFQGKDNISLKCPGCGEVIKVFKDPNPEDPSSPPTSVSRCLKMSSRRKSMTTSLTPIF